MNGKPRGKTISNCVRVVTSCLYFGNHKFHKSSVPQHPTMRQTGATKSRETDCDFACPELRKTILKRWSAQFNAWRMRAVEAVDDLSSFLRLPGGSLGKETMPS